MTYFETQSVREADRTIAIYIDASSFPNWNGVDQTRGFAITGDQLTLTARALPTGDTLKLFGREPSNPSSSSPSGLSRQRTAVMSLIGLFRPFAAAQRYVRSRTDCVAKGVLHWGAKILRVVGAAFV